MPEPFLSCAKCGAKFAVHAKFFYLGGWVLGENIDGNVKFCSFCGAKLVGEEDAPAAFICGGDSDESEMEK